MNSNPRNGTVNGASPRRRVDARWLDVATAVGFLPNRAQADSRNTIIDFGRRIRRLYLPSSAAARAPAPVARNKMSPLLVRRPSLRREHTCAGRLFSSAGLHACAGLLASSPARLRTAPVRQLSAVAGAGVDNTMSRRPDERLFQSARDFAASTLNRAPPLPNVSIPPPPHV